MTGDPVRVGVWGATGRHAQRKLLPAIRACGEIALVAEAGRYGRALLEDPRIEAIVVATPTGLHHEHGLAVLAAGKHLWCEKAMSLRGDELVAEGRAANLGVCEMFMYAHHPQLAWMQALRGVERLACTFGIPHQDRSGYRYVQALGGGALLDVGCYAIHAAMMMLGAPLPLHAARVVRPAGEPVDTSGTATLGTAELSWAYGVDYINEMRAWTARGEYVAEKIFGKPADQTSIIRTPDGIVEIPPADAFVRMLSCFARASRDDQRERERQWKLAEDQARHLRAIASSPRA